MSLIKRVVGMQSCLHAFLEIGGKILQLCFHHYNTLMSTNADSSFMYVFVSSLPFLNGHSCLLCQLAVHVTWKYSMPLLGAVTGNPCIVFVLTSCCMASCYASSGIYVGMYVCMVM